ncbi:alkane 1-monooxygenase [uncultured Eudoraea sp.]|uniref:alkane 1-monooxygenase n=1 Tax=uncultured Eudoraea sp. TaxID=1035614 RepID=UPI00262A7959|nr:alkane 1-monooxygenase [uncultured Eudoraea sp.]
MKDLKYLAAFTIPLSAYIGINLAGYWSFITPVYAFIFIPVLELLLPIDESNFEGEVKVNRQKKKLFDWLLYLNIPLVFGILIYTLITLSRNTFETFELAGIIFSLGIVLGTNGINVAHELGHRQVGYERFLGKLLLLPSLYMHFFIEHNYGHHLHAATKEDPATARYNQSVYSFWVTSVFRQYANAWVIQRNLLKSEAKGFFSLQNDMLWFSLLQLGYLVLIYFFFGFEVLVFAIAAALVGFLLLETVNYIEHYGLIRKKLPSGRYERVSEIHSWNSNHVMGRIILYELTRHSDHHYKSSKKYQVLNCYDISPQMPFGYPTSMVISLVPPLWFSIMNPRIPEEMKKAAA